MKFKKRIVILSLLFISSIFGISFVCYNVTLDTDWYAVPSIICSFLIMFVLLFLIVITVEDYEV